MLRKFASGVSCVVTGLMAELLFCVVLGLVLTAAWHVCAGIGRILGL